MIPNRGVVHKLARYLNMHPAFLQSLQTGVIMGIGDSLAQSTASESTEKTDFDYKRLLCFSAIGFFFVGPVVSNWYTYLEKRIPKDKSGSKFVTGLKKMALDQLVFVPPMIPSVICLREMLIGSGNIEGAVKEVKSHYFEILRANYMVWPMFQLINFILVPLPYRVLAAQLAGVGWNTFLSKVLSTHEETTD